MGWNDISIQISIKYGSEEFRIGRVVCENQLPFLFGPIDHPAEKIDDIYCTPKEMREKILRNREEISKILAEEFMNYFGKDDTKMGYKL